LVARYESGPLGKQILGNGVGEIEGRKNVTVVRGWQVENWIKGTYYIFQGATVDPVDPVESGDNWK